MTTTRLLAAALVLASTAVAAADPQLVGRVSDPDTKKPVAGVSVVLISPTGQLHEVITDDNGLYHAPVPEAGAYAVTFQLGEGIVHKTIAIEPNQSASLDAQLPGPSETIVITEHISPPVLPAPRWNSKKLPPYSDALILDDKWVKQWVLVELDERGDVARMKFLHGPPKYDLEQIAIQFVFGMHFSPARDEHGKAIRTQFAWPIEWPSYWWMIAIGLPPTALPVVYGPELRKEPPDPMRLDPTMVLSPSPIDFVPCAGSGPMHLAAIHPVYRDCTQPDLATADKQPWIDRAQFAAALQRKH